MRAADAALFCAVHDILQSPDALRNVLSRLRPGARVAAGGDSVVIDVRGRPFRVTGGAFDVDPAIFGAGTRDATPNRAAVPKVTRTGPLREQAFLCPLAALQ